MVGFMMFFGGRWNLGLHSIPQSVFGTESRLRLFPLLSCCAPAAETSLFSLTEFGYLRGVKGGVAGGVVTGGEVR